MAGSGGDAPRGRAPGELPGADEAPTSSSSGVRSKKPASLRRDTPPFRQLTPYQARLDVEMDDTAVGKVRDPSVSISMDPLRDPALAPRRRKRADYIEAAISVVAGVLLGALLVVVSVMVLRSF